MDTKKESDKVAKARAEYIRMADAQALRPCRINEEAKRRALDKLQSAEAAEAINRRMEISESKSAKHTPGPWITTNTEEPGNTLIYHDDGKGREPGEIIAAVYCNEEQGNDMPDSEVAANARLIAAAPELLVALEKCEAKFSDLHDGYPASTAGRAVEPLRREIRAAIAKAKGKL